MVRAEAARTLVLAMLGHMRYAGQLALQLVPRAEAIGDIEALRLALAQAAEWAMLAGDFVESHATRQRELVTAKRTGATSATPFVQANIAQLCLYMGEWDKASSYAENALFSFLALGDRFRTSYPLAYLGELALRRGNREEGVRRLGECSDIAKQSNDVQVLRYAERLLAEEEIRSGQSDQAIARLLPLVDRSAHEGHDMPLLLMTLSWARLILGDCENAELDLAASLARATAEGNNFALQEALRVRGLLHAKQSRPTEAVSDFHESIRLAHHMPYPFAEARTLVDYAGSLQESGQFAEARTAIEEALAIFHRLGASQEIRVTSHALARRKPAHPVASPRLDHGQ